MGWRRLLSLGSSSWCGALSGRSAGLGGRRSRGLRRAFLKIAGRGRIAIFGVQVDGAADGATPAVGAERVDVFALGEMDGLDQGLGEIGDRGSRFGLDVALRDGGDETAKGNAEVAGGDVIS